MTEGLSLLIVRHGVAQERRPGLRDEKRKLTRDGAKRARDAFEGLRLLLDDAPSAVLTSPLPRAAATAALLSRALRGEKPSIERSLSPGGSSRTLIAALARTSGLVAVVGHEPDLGRLACLLLTGKPGDWLPLGKAGACLLRFDATPARGRATLEWALRPSQLRAIAGR
jgi:phosphohistidine phosphatase